MAGREIVVGVSGASGAWLARRFVELALADRALGVLHLVFTAAALRVAAIEIYAGISSPQDWIDRLSTGERTARRRIALHAHDDVAAPIASGSYPTDGMIVIPCSGGALGAIANCISRDL